MYCPCRLTILDTLSGNISLTSGPWEARVSAHFPDNRAFGGSVWQGISLTSGSHESGSREAGFREFP